jgi:hypothetical protein
MIGIGTARRAAAAAIAALALAAALAGCGTIATNDSVEEQIKSQLGTDTAECPTDLDGEVGQSIICKGAIGDDSFDVKVTVTSIEGDTINFDIERVGGAPPTTDATGAGAEDAAEVDGKDVAQSVFDQLAAGGKKVDEVTCPDLPAQAGESVRCSLTSGTDTYGVTVTVTSVQGTDVKFDIRVDRTPS